MRTIFRWLLIELNCFFFNPSSAELCVGETWIKRRNSIKCRLIAGTWAFCFSAARYLFGSQVAVHPRLHFLIINFQIRFLRGVHALPCMCACTRVFGRRCELWFIRLQNGVPWKIIYRTPFKIHTQIFEEGSSISRQFPLRFSFDSSLHFRFGLPALFRRRLSFSSVRLSMDGRPKELSFPPASCLWMRKGF